MKFIQYLVCGSLCLCLVGPGFAQPASDEAVPEFSIPDDIPPPPPPPDPLILKPDGETGTYRLTVAQTVERAWQENPGVKAADARVRSAYWSMQEAESLPSAALGLGTYQGGREGATLANSNYIAEARADYYIWLVQPFRPLGATNTARRIAYRDLTQAQSQATLTRIQLAQQAKDAYYNLMAAEQQELVAQKNLALAEEVLNTTHLRFSKGSGPRLDEINATIQRNRTRQDLTLARGQLGQAQARLAPLLGVSAHSLVQTDGALEPPAGHYIYETLLELARQHPRLKVAQDVLSQSTQVRLLAEQQNNITPNILAVYDIIKPSYMVQLTLSIPIDWGVIRNDVRQKMEIEREKEQALYSEQLALSSDLRQAYEAYQAAYDNAHSYYEEVLKPSEESARITEYGYRRGALPYLQLLTMQQQLSSIRKDYLDRQLAVHLALDALEAMVGRQLEGVNL